MKKTILSVLILLLVFTVNAQTERKYFTMGAGMKYDYIISSQKSNSNPSNTLFAGNGHSIGLQLELKSLPKKLTTQRKAYTKVYDENNKAIEDQEQRKLSSTMSLGIALKFDASFQFGKTSSKDLEAFAKSLTAPVGYRITQSNTKWNQIVVMAGPVLSIAKLRLLIHMSQLPLIHVGTTIGFVKKLNPKTIKIDKVDGAVTGARVFDKTESSTSFAWQANVSIPVANLGKRLNLCLEGGYGFNGGNVGISFRAGYFYENPKKLNK